MKSVVIYFSIAAVQLLIFKVECLLICIALVDVTSSNSELAKNLSILGKYFYSISLEFLFKVVYLII
jgi:hypothetical protein